MANRTDEYKICTNRIPDGTWFWEVFFNGESIDQASSHWNSTTYGLFRWSAKRKAKASAKTHAKHQAILQNPRRECEIFQP